MVVRAQQHQKQHKGLVEVEVGEKGEVSFNVETKVGDLVLKPGSYQFQHRAENGELTNLVPHDSILRPAGSAPRLRRLAFPSKPPPRTAPARALAAQHQAMAKCRSSVAAGGLSGRRPVGLGGLRT